MTDNLPYRDPKRPVEERVDDLLARMTLEEKVGQMMQLDGRVEPLHNIDEKHPGSFLQILGDDTVAPQRHAQESRLGIPLLFGVDAIHGHSFWPGATIFPTQLGIACSWDADLIEEAGRITALEMSYTGLHWTFSPVLCMARDLRWGRVNETFGEDPYLIGKFATALIRGLQGTGLGDRRAVLACAKHYAGYSETIGGRDASEANHSRRRMRAEFLPPFEEAARAGCATFMTGYQAIDGVPCTMNHWLLTELLKEEWGFQGFVVTDWDNVGRLVREQLVCETMDEAGAAAVVAGNDMMMSTPSAYAGTVEAVKAGRISEDLVDAACRRILRVKFAMGLFEDPRLPDLKAGRAVIGCDAHREAALRAARESIVLLKYDDAVLPLDAKKLTRIAVIGPNADDPIAQLGDWSLGTGQANGGKTHPRESIVTVLDGIQARFAEQGSVEVVYAKGCSATEAGADDLAEAAAAARESDVAIVVVGDQIPQTGEFKSTATLELQGGQQALLEAVHATGTPMVVMLVNSKPLAIPWIAGNAAAVLEAFNPGMLGGTALAEILFGDVNPSGRLPISIPRHVGQQPVHYNHIAIQHGGTYVDGVPFAPLYAFGEGLSYTNFAYSNLRVIPDAPCSAKESLQESGAHATGQATARSSDVSVSEVVLRAGDPLRVAVDITNTGARAGIETAQLYLNDVCTSATWPHKVLKDFARVAIDPGVTRTIAFEVPHEALAIVNAQGERVVEPGAFEVMVGPSSRDGDLLKATFRVA